MSARPPYSSTSSHSSHGGNMDPNMVRRNQGQAPGSPGSSHGGAMDPNAVRNQQIQMRTTSGPSSPQIPGSHGTSPRYNVAQGQQSPPSQVPYAPGQYSGAGTSPIPGYQTYAAPPTPQSTHSGQYFPPQPPQSGYQPSQFNHGQQTPPAQSPGYKSQATVTYYPASTPSPLSPEATYAQSPSYGPAQTWPVGSPPSPKKKSKIRRVNNDVGHGPEEKGVYPHYRGQSEQGYKNVLHSRSQWRVKWPNVFQPAGVPRSMSDHRHRDMMQRVKDFAAEDYYLSPSDGHLAKLFVQSTQEIYDADANSTWRRTFIRNQSPYILRLANWVLEGLSKNGQEASGEDLAITAAKWIPTCVAILFLMIIPVQAEGEVRNEGKYDALPYTFWGYAYHAKNPREDKIEYSQLAAFSRPSPTPNALQRKGTNSALNPISERPIEPKYLCFLLEKQGMEIREVSDWKKKHDIAATYILVSYTSEQFPTEEDQLYLHDVGEHAARAAGVQAYWVGCSCLGSTKEEQESNVWRISDVVRGARSMVIAVSNPGGQEQGASENQLLYDWGTRVWTLPEVLLTPANSEIQVFSRNASLDAPMTVYKRNFATIWGDSSISRELIDHYEGNLTLSSLELVTIALQSLHSRQKGFYLEGDMAYALMGLLRRRPTVVKSDSAFQAFARLSLANDNDLLLERLICVLPKTPSQPWYNMDDQWDVSLWDILPSTQVCGIADNDTVLIDGGYAATIRWKAFAPVANMKRDSWARFFFRYFFRSISYWFFLGVAFIGIGSRALVPLGAIFITVALLIILASPYIIRILYSGKLWAQQAWFFGFEGYMDIESIERHIFGANMNYLKWSTNGSPLSIHSANEYGECMGHDPTTNPETAEKVKNAINAKMGDQRIFTLVDTKTLTVTMFEAARPPVAVIVAGAEGGMQRALLCSYDWATQTMYRESVIRLETLVLDQMSRVGRLRLGLRREGL